MRILLVEDEALVRTVVATSLTDMGFHVTDVDSGDAAWKHIEKNLPFDLLITDVRMPSNINGIELAHRVRTRTSDALIIIMSGYVGERQPKEHGFHNFLPKPFTVGQLSSVIGGLCQAT